MFAGDVSGVAAATVWCGLTRGACASRSQL